MTDNDNTLGSQFNVLLEGIAATAFATPDAALLVPDDLRIGAPGFVISLIAELHAKGEFSPAALPVIAAERRSIANKAGDDAMEWQKQILRIVARDTFYADEIPAMVDKLRRIKACGDAVVKLDQARHTISLGDIDGGQDELREVAATLAGWAADTSEVIAADDAMIALAAQLDGTAERVDRIYSGFTALDRAVGTVMAAGRLVVLAARPGVGKTAFALNIAAHVARSAPVLYWCGEMSGHELFARAVASHAQVPLTLIMERKLDLNSRAKVNEAMGRVAGLRLAVNTSAGMTVAKLDAMVRMAAAQGRKPRVVVADYLQRMKSADSRSREEEVGGIARDLKELAKAHGICVLALAQMNREIEKRTNPRPRLSDLRDSGQIEQEADAIVFPDRSSVETGPDTRWPVPATLYIEKFRHGMSGVAIPMRWDGPFQQWSNGQ